MYLKAENNNISQNVLRNYLHQPDVLDEKIISVDNSHETIRFFNFKNYKIKLENYSQQVFYQSILKDDLVFSIGAAGSGKTFLAIGAALHCYELGFVKKIILVRLSMCTACHGSSFVAYMIKHI